MLYALSSDNLLSPNQTCTPYQIKPSSSCVFYTIKIQNLITAFDECILLHFDIEVLLIVIQSSVGRFLGSQFLFQCIQLTSNVFWQLNFFILFHDYFKVSSGQFCQINLNAYSYYSLWLSTEFLNLHCPWYNFVAFYCFYLYNQRICSFVQLSCYIYLSVL